MRKMLIVAATPAEAGFLAKGIKKAGPGQLIALPSFEHFQIDVLITGAGIAATTYHLTRTLAANQYKMAINVGLCGSLDPDTKPVKIINIISDQFGDFGAENGKDWLDVFEMGLTNKNEHPFKKGKLFSTYKTKLNSLNAISKAVGITVQRVHGSTSSCRKAFKKFGPVMESMEGAAFFYVCAMEKVQSLQIRVVSNKVERRNKNNWKIPQALDALAGFTGLMLLEIENKG